MTVNAQYAAEHFEDLASAADKGEQIEIERPGKPTLVLVSRPVGRPTPSGRPRRELWGAWEGLVEAPSQAEWDKIHEEFLATLPDAFKHPDEAA